MHFLPWREHQWSAELGHVHKLYHFCHVRQLHGTQNGIKLNLKEKKKKKGILKLLLLLRSLVCCVWGFFVWVFCCCWIPLILYSFLLSSSIFTIDLIELSLDRRNKRTFFSWNSVFTWLSSYSSNYSFLAKCPQVHCPSLSSYRFHVVLFSSPPCTALDFGKAYNSPTTYVLKIPAYTVNTTDSTQTKIMP